MIAEVECENLPLTNVQVKRLLDNSCKRMFRDTDGLVAVRCVSSDDIQRLNSVYRANDNPTNVLTFSYDDTEHDVALCMDVAMREASERNAQPTDYVALLLVHAFLHVLGLDHEKSAQEDEKTQALEKQILEESGFMATSLSVSRL